MMENLPCEIALNILSRLPIAFLVRVKCVCKTWRALAQDPRLPSIYNEQANTRNPCLILRYCSPVQDKLCFVNLSDSDSGGPNPSSSKVRRIDAKLKSAISEYHVVGSCNGLLCLSDALHSDPRSVYNPFTGDYIELPEETHFPQQVVVSIGFGYHPITKEYKVVRIAYIAIPRHDFSSMGWTMKLDVQVLTLGSDTWRSLGGVPWRLDSRAAEALLNGALHWVATSFQYHLSKRSQIISFDLADEEFREIERPSCGSLEVCDYHLVVLGGCLSAVHCLPDRGMEIWVMKEYNVKESWIKDYVIGPYLPSSLINQNAPARSERLRDRGSTQVLCILKNGKILVEYENGALVSYNPERKEFKDLVISGLPKWFDMIVHVESLLPVEAILGRI